MCCYKPQSVYVTHGEKNNVFAVSIIICSCQAHFAVSTEKSTDIINKKGESPTMIQNTYIFCPCIFC